MTTMETLSSEERVIVTRQMKRKCRWKQPSAQKCCDGSSAARPQNLTTVATPKNKDAAVSDIQRNKLRGAGVGVQFSRKMDSILGDLDKLLDRPFATAPLDARTNAGICGVSVAAKYHQVAPRGRWS